MNKIDFAERLNAYRIVPRLMVFGYSLLMLEVARWFMALPEPSNQQMAFITVMVGAATGIFGLYTNSSK